MGCDKYVEWMSAALDGELTAEERRELDSHLAVCPECAALFELLSRNALAMRKLDCQFPAGLHDRIMSNLPPQQAPAKKNKVIHWKRWGSLAACLVLVVALGAFGRFGFRMGSMAPAAAEMAMQEAPAGNTKTDGGYGMHDNAVESESKIIVPESPAASPAVTFSKVHYLRIDWQEGMAAPSATVITNTESLAHYLDEIRAPYDNEAEDLVFEDVLETYSTDFFTDRSLLLVLLEENSGSISHEIKSITGDTVTIRRVVPEAGTCDMAGWLLLVELDEVLDNGSVLSVAFTK